MADMNKFLDEQGTRHLVQNIKDRFQKKLKPGSGISIAPGTGADAGKEIISTSSTAYTVDPTKTGNEAFASDEQKITIAQFTDENNQVITTSELPTGTSIYVLGKDAQEKPYPDRWYTGSNNEFQIEEIKIDLSDYQKKSDADLQTTATTVVGGINENKGKIDTHSGNNDIHVTKAQKDSWDAKQDALTNETLDIAVKNISIGDKINISREGGRLELSGDNLQYVYDAVTTDLPNAIAAKQDKLTAANAGDNITITTDPESQKIKINANLPQVDYPVTDVLVDGETVVEGKVAKISFAELAKEAELTAHTTDDDIHVTAEDKTKWNDKQDKLEAGENIKIEGGEISAIVPSLQGYATETFVTNLTDALDNRLDSIEGGYLKSADNDTDKEHGTNRLKVVSHDLSGDHEITWSPASLTTNDIDLMFDE